MIAGFLLEATSKLSRLLSETLKGWSSVLKRYRTISIISLKKKGEIGLHFIAILRASPTQAVGTQAAECIRACAR